MSSFSTTSLSFLPSILPLDLLPRAFIYPRFHFRSVLFVLSFEQLIVHASGVAVCFSSCGPIMAHIILPFAGPSEASVSQVHWIVRQLSTLFLFHVLGLCK